MPPERIPKTITKGFPKPPAYATDWGAMYCGDSLEHMRSMPGGCVDLVVTSPPFALVRKKDYGNLEAERYVTWFAEFGHEVKRILKETGSFVIDIGGSWLPGSPVRSTYHYKLLIELTKPGMLYLAQDFFWYSPSKLPTPAEWVTVRKVRVKDAVNTIWWLSKTPFPKASNERMSVEYSEAMRDLLRNGYTAKKRPSGHDISTKFQKDRGGAIPSNLIVVSHTTSNDYYQRRCRETNVPVHPARFPLDIPLYFINMLTDERDLVLDIFAGSNVTGWVCEHMKRRWLAFELEADFVKGSTYRFEKNSPALNGIEYISGKKEVKFRRLRMTSSPAKLPTGQKRGM
ncbi:MAG: site-specific DNA-methyltransferase [Dehalococcoidia bacterium]|nr:site-specific DNA-methyltransferase [Dehalococcoidia bacterium]